MTRQNYQLPPRAGTALPSAVMNAILSLNLSLAWLWILLGFVSGMVLGMFFHDEKWLGGYASHKRRMYRLGHISFFGLGVVNLFFYFTARLFDAAAPLLPVAAWAFMVGAVSMPVCCVIMAHRPKAHLIFSLPVISLILGGTLTLLSLFSLHIQPSTLHSP